MKITVTESVSCTEDKIDVANGVIRGVKVLGFESKNGYDYAASAVQKAAPLYEGVDVNIDHPDRKEPSRERGVKEQWAVLRSPRFVESVGVVADMHYLVEHPETKVNLERIRRNMCVGLSHVAEVAMTKPCKGKRSCVESIERVLSVDFVRKPATTKNLFESEEQKMIVKAKDLAAKATKETVKTLLESAADSIEFESTGDDANDIRLACGLVLEAQVDKPAKKDEKPAPDTSEITKLMESQNAVTKSLAESITFLMEREKARDKRDLIHRVLEANAMNYGDLSPDRQQLLESMKDEEGMKRLVGTWPPVVRGRRGQQVTEGAVPSGAFNPAPSFSELKKRLHA